MLGYMVHIIYVQWDRFVSASMGVKHGSLHLNIELFLCNIPEFLFSRVTWVSRSWSMSPNCCNHCDLSVLMIM